MCLISDVCVGFYLSDHVHIFLSLVLVHLVLSQYFWRTGTDSFNHLRLVGPFLVVIILLQTDDISNLSEYLPRIMGFWVWDMAHQICQLEQQSCLSPVGSLNCCVNAFTSIYSLYLLCILAKSWQWMRLVIRQL